MIDFGIIRSDGQGRRHAFEEMICQLARREEPERGGAFRRVEGSGGDGGVEGYWLCSDGSKVGYQAKYFLSSAEIDWTQIDCSVAQALATHPQLVRYIVAVPCDFTDRAGKRGRGKTGWEHWSARKALWEKKALATLGHEIEFVPWTKFELTNRLIAPAASGLRAYWFGGIEFSQTWFKTRVERAKSELDERYHPEDHVDVRLQSLFDFVARHPRARDELRGRFDQIKEHSLPDLSDLGASPPDDLVAAALSAIDALREREVSLSFPSWLEWDADQVRNEAEQAEHAVVSLVNWARTVRDNLTGSENERTRQKLYALRRELQQLIEAIEALKNLAKGSYLSAEGYRVCLIEGRAGSGKSHLLGSAADAAISEGRPVLLILGQQLRDGPIWPQIRQRLDLGSLAVDDFLGALDSASEANGVRGLILIDALNEGPGARLWRNEVAGLVADIRRFKNLACVLTCRSEYIDYVIPEGVRSFLPCLEVRGFETPAERESAARVYLDKRGISRPATPWLAPEFTNPLFLRSACIALKQEGKSEFPRGLSGTKALLAFFIRSAGRHLGVGRDGSDELIPSVRLALIQVARAIAFKRQDCLARMDAAPIVASAFANFPSPEGLTWLEVLQRRSLLRFDPDPSSDANDPLSEVGDVVRFSFQRFQDHLMAEALLDACDDVGRAFGAEGSLSFIFDDSDIEPQWQGLVEALSIQVPERFSLELVDCLPTRPSHKWWSQYGIQDAFAESVRWRSKDSFTDRTLELLNHLSPGGMTTRLSLLIELSASIGHPWNAELLHRNLIRRKLPDRDAFWTVDINRDAQNDEHPVHRLIDWCLLQHVPHIARETQWLCAITLTWLFASSNRFVRDRATKALTKLLTEREGLFDDLITKFQGVDDLYISERMWAAAFGAACCDPTKVRLSKYASIAADTVFGLTVPPLNLLLRDYARGIVELAKFHDALPDRVRLETCRPPYASGKARLTVTEGVVEKMAKKAGGEAIYSSCARYGDFGRYEIQPAIAHFLSVDLSQNRPVSRQELFEEFETAVVGEAGARRTAFERILKAKSEVTRVRWRTGKKGQFEVRLTNVPRKVAAFHRAVAAFQALLSPGEVARYKLEADPHLSPLSPTEPRPEIIAPLAAQLWIAKRAYQLGWTAKRFGQDAGSFGDHGRGRASVERIGKKYQWLALDELLCRLADNNWMTDVFERRCRTYDTPVDLGFIRDIDPTIFDDSGVVPKHGESALDDALMGSRILIQKTAEENLKAWAFSSDPAASFDSLIERSDATSKRWVTLYEHRHCTERYHAKPRTIDHGSRQQEFRFLLSVAVKRREVLDFASSFSDQRNVDVMSWDPPDFTDGPYLLEAPWRDTWPKEDWAQSWQGKGFPRFKYTVCNYRWESHLDASLPKGGAAFLPSPWIARGLNLRPLTANPNSYVDEKDSIIFRSIDRPGDGTAAFMRADVLDGFLAREELTLLWIFVAERCVWPGGNNSNAAWRRSEGVAWLDHGSFVVRHWHNDTDNSKHNRAAS